MRHLLDLLSAALAHLVLSIFFRRVETEGLAKVPPRGPLLVVANHPNGLIDPVVLLGALPRPIRFLGKSTLWDLIPLRPFLALAGVIPVYRPTDPGTDPAKNVETFARCREVLLDGAAVALFPEGTSHPDPSVRPLKTGAARIALGTAAQALSQAQSQAGSQTPPGPASQDRESLTAPEPVRILPVGLTFDARERFRSRALLVVGDPIEVRASRPWPEGPDREEARGLTDRIHQGLRQVAADYTSWREAQLFQRAVEIYERPSRKLPGTTALAELHRTARNLAEGFAAVRELEPERTRRLARAMGRYDRVLALLALRDDQVAARYPLLGVLRFFVRTLALLALGLPLAAAGTLLNLIPYLAVGRIAGRSKLGVEEQASWKLFGGLFLYPLFWCLQALAVGWLLGGAAGLATALVTPLAGYVALVFWERGGRLWRESRAFVMLRTRPRIRSALRGMRSALRAEVEELSGLWEATARP